ncbi:ubiquitin-like protein Pup [Arcanobacterium hippocoleae]|uniref:Prokaryotic ubiquitin-like protein Pup n=1 Tax=Arcanobacterium hippocoleae TaxID=149017 RepID=A0ABU1T0D3_9ACTO|nr:ubiquitin-like protein Pup [Arcanobacterium hippocoleae]MDR6938817.1 ubiquitin-like protein Pup [Arcanobacterium hippocoleae]
MAERIYQQVQKSSQNEVTPAVLPSAGTQDNEFNVADLLADIDSLLETNAESFVQGFVQKGGQ